MALNHSNFNKIVISTSWPYNMTVTTIYFKQFLTQSRSTGLLIYFDTKIGQTDLLTYLTNWRSGRLCDTKSTWTPTKLPYYSYIFRNSIPLSWCSYNGKHSLKMTCGGLWWEGNWFTFTGKTFVIYLYLIRSLNQIYIFFKNKIAFYFPWHRIYNTNK